MPRTRLTILDGEELHVYSSANSFLGVFSLDSSGNIIVKNGTFPNSAERLRIAPGGKVRLSTTTASQIVTTDSNNDLTSISLLTTALGGTNNAGAYTDGDLLYYNSGTSKFANLADVATGNALISGGVAAAPSWGKIGLTTHIDTSGVLSIANGGTNKTSFTNESIIFFDGTRFQENNAKLYYDIQSAGVNEILNIGGESATWIYGYDSNLGRIGASAQNHFRILILRIQSGGDLSSVNANGVKVFEFGASGSNLLIGFFGVTAIVRTSAYTQTYSTASSTMPNRSSTAVSTTAATQTTPWGYSTQAQADDIITQINNLVTDVNNAKKFVNSLIDDCQSYGLLQ